MVFHFLLQIQPLKKLWTWNRSGPGQFLKTWSVSETSEEALSLYFFDFLDFGVIVGRGGCRAGVDLLVVFEQPCDLSQKQSEDRLTTLTLLLLTYFIRMETQWVDSTGPVTTVSDTLVLTSPRNILWICLFLWSLDGVCLSVHSLVESIATASGERLESTSGHQLQEDTHTQTHHSLTLRSNLESPVKWIRRFWSVREELEKKLTHTYRDGHLHPVMSKLESTLKPLAWSSCSNHSANICVQSPPDVARGDDINSLEVPWAIWMEVPSLSLMTACIFSNIWFPTSHLHMKVTIWRIWNPLSQRHKWFLFVLICDKHDQRIWLFSVIAGCDVPCGIVLF